MSLNPEVIDLLPLPIQVPPQGDDPSDLVYRKAPVVSYWILPEPVADSPVGPDIDVNSLDPGHLRVDGGILVDPDGLVAGRDHEDGSVVVEVLRSNKRAQ